MGKPYFPRPTPRPAQTAQLTEATLRSWQLLKVKKPPSHWTHFPHLQKKRVWRGKELTHFFLKGGQAPATECKTGPAISRFGFREWAFGHFVMGTEMGKPGWPVSDGSVFRRHASQTERECNSLPAGREVTQGPRKERLLGLPRKSRQML